MADDALQIARRAAQGFTLFECEECAQSVKEALVAAGYSGETIEIHSGGARPFILCFSYDGGQQTITENGRHVAVRIAGMAFDNLHPDGQLYEDWLADFDSVRGIRVTIVTSF